MDATGRTRITDELPKQVRVSHLGDALLATNWAAGSDCGDDE